MSANFLDGFGGLMKGLSGFMPQDDPNVKILNAQTELNELLAKEMEIYAKIGKQAVDENGLEHYGSIADHLKLIQFNIVSTKEKLEEANKEKAEQERAQQEPDETSCPNCGYVNPDGTKFCSECGSKLISDGIFCGECGTKNLPDTKFCSNCGSKL